MFPEIKNFGINLLISNDEVDKFFKDQYRYLDKVNKGKGYFTQNDLKHSYKILKDYQSKTYINRVRKFTNKESIINNIEKIVMLRKKGLSHDKISKMVTVSKGTVQKYLKLLEVD